MQGADDREDEEIRIRIRKLKGKNGVFTRSCPTTLV